MYVPAGKLLLDCTTSFVALFFITTVEFALLVIAIEPSEAPKQVALVATPLTLTATDGWPIVTVVDAVHVWPALPPGAVAVSVYTPAGNPVEDTTSLVAFVITTDEPTLFVMAIEPFDSPKHVALVGTPLTLTATVG